MRAHNRPVKGKLVNTALVMRECSILDSQESRAPVLVTCEEVSADESRRLTYLIPVSGKFVPPPHRMLQLQRHVPPSETAVSKSNSGHRRLQRSMTSITL